MPNLIVTLFVVSLFSFPSFAYRTANEAGRSDTSILQECLWNKDVIDLDVQCNDLYNHYLPEKVRKNQKKKIRLGSYNIFRSYEQQQKRWDLTAKMIDDEWDLVALSELQPNKAGFLQANVNAAVAWDKGKISKTEFASAYIKPSYLVMLEELQKLDSSWGLIISPYTQSEADTELFAFAYRANQVDLVESPYCKAKYIDQDLFPGAFIQQEIRAEKFLRGSGSSEGVVKSDDGKPISNRDFIKPERGEAYACILALDEMGQNNFNKIPLTAHFESGDFDFSYISSHLGFRGPHEGNVDGELVKKGKCLKDCEVHTRELMNHILDTIEDNKVKTSLAEGLDLDSDLKRETSRQMVRFFQAYQIYKSSVEIRDLNGDKDVVIAGDFNLNPSDRGWQGQMWDYLNSMLGTGTELFVDDYTSVSAKKGYSKKYDHFIFNPSTSHVSECDSDTASSFDFLLDDIETSAGFDLAEEMEKYTDPANFDELTKITTAQFTDRNWVSSQGDLFTPEDLRNIVDKSDGTEYRSLQVRVTKVCDAKGVEELEKPKWMNILDAQINETYCKFHLSFETDKDGKPTNSFIRFMFALSDHLPIGMSCTTD